MKVTLLIILTFLGLNAKCQKYEVTALGLRDSSNKEKTYLILETKELTAQTAFRKALRFVNEKYKNPEKAITSKLENDYLKFNTFEPNFIFYDNSGVKVGIQANFTTELSFKDGKVKFEITSLDMTSKTSNYKVLFSGGLMSGYVIYKKNGKLFKEETKIDIENYFNAYVLQLHKYFRGKTSSDDW